MQWLNTLNDRVFFWLHPQRLEQLLNARRNRGRPHDVLTVDTASLINQYHDRVRLSAINSGATLYPGAPERGPSTFRTIEDYPYGEHRRRRTPQTAVVELAVLGGVPDIADHVIDVQSRLGPIVIADRISGCDRAGRGSRPAASRLWLDDGTHVPGQQMLGNLAEGVLGCGGSRDEREGPDNIEAVTWPLLGYDRFRSGRQR